MMNNSRAVDRPPPSRVPFHQFSNFSYSAEQPFSVGLGTDFGHSHGYFNDQMDAREFIRRQIEKEKIREEIIAQEIARRRILEAEVRMELMREREAAMLRGQQLQPEERSLEERIVRLLEERFGVGISTTGMANRGENERSQVVPFLERGIESWTSEVPFKQLSAEPRSLELKPLSGLQNVEPNISEVKTSPELGKEKDRIIFKAKPDTNVSGVKRKEETPPEAAISSELPTGSVPKKKAKEAWSCALCQVCATSKDGLNEHLHGKKHKSKEAAIKAQRDGKNFSIGFFTKKPAELVEMTDDVKSQESSLDVPAMKGCPNGNDAPSLKIDDDHSGNDSKEKSAELVQNKRKKMKFKFWCEHCKIGAFSVKVMEDHKTGKKHLSRVKGVKCVDTAENVNGDDEKGTKENKPEIGVMEGHMMSKEDSSQPQEMKSTQLDTATEKAAIITQQGPEASVGGPIFWWMMQSG